MRDADDPAEEEEPPEAPKPAPLVPSAADSLDSNEDSHAEAPSVVIEQAAEQIAVRLERQFRRETFSGPMPPPRLLAQYEQIYPGAAKIIITNYEHESKHRREIERFNAHSDSRARVFGMFCGVVVLLAVTATAFFAVYRNYPIASTILALGTVGTLAAVFITGRARTEPDVEPPDGSQSGNSPGKPQEPDTATEPPRA